ncbi:MAG: aspartate kinase, partial [Deltaproteobacteria bacterium]|nr:aspartate kinase [Deltaproteobacteria bacterium]
MSTGEQVTIALLALAIQNLGVPSVSYLGHQVRILTDDSYSKARIRSIDDENIQRDLKAGKIVVVAGFQGVDEKGNLTTLGRGGSDTTAVAIAAALKADACEIYTDVDGVYTTDPNICSDARKIDHISYEEMLEMASTGAKVLQIRSVEMGAKYNVPIEVRSSFNDHPGTWVTKEETKMESRMVTGVSLNKDEAKIAVRQVPDTPGVASKIFGPISDANINVDMIVQNVSSEGTTDLTFTLPKSELKRAL